MWIMSLGKIFCLVYFLVLVGSGTIHGLCSHCASVSIFENNHTYDCSSCDLSEIPTFPNGSQVISLFNNRISAIQRESFRWLTNLHKLNLSLNVITTIESNSFYNLSSMKILDLSWNNLSQATLENLKFPSTLQSLDIRVNPYKKYPDSLKFLTQLRILKIDIFEGFHFGDTFLSLSKLSEIIFDPITHFTLPNNAFEGLRNSPLTDLALNFSGLAKTPVGIDFLRPFRYLKRFTFNMGGNFDIIDILKYLHGLRNTTLDEMDISGNNWYSYRKHFLRKKDLENLLTICVREINVGYSYIYLFPFLDALDSTFSHCLEKLVVVANQIVWTAAEIFGLVYFPSIKYLDISITLPCKDESELKQFSGDKLYKPMYKHVNVTTNALKKLEFLDLSGINLRNGIIHSDFLRYYSVVFDTPNLRTLRASYTYAQFCNFDNYFKGNLSVLDMSGWDCGRVNPKFIQRHNKLTFLNASFTGIGHYINRKQHSSLFTGLSKLETLDISYNKILGFRKDFFRDQNISLRFLNISNNRIQRIPLTIISLSRLISIDLSYNLFEYFDVHDRHIIDFLGRTEFNFDGNYFDCSCRNVDCLVWMNMSKNIINLACKDKNMTEILRNIHYFQLECLSEFWLDFSIVSSLLFMIAIVVVAVGYRNKSLVVYLYIKARRMVKQIKIQTEENKFKYDAFVSYSHMDEEWVTGPLFQFLTNELSLHICIHHKDFIPGEPIAEEILRCIESSRKSVFVITRNFLASEWSLFEMDIARRHVFQSDSDTILVVLKDDIPVHEMPNLLKKIWWRIVCLKYPQDNDAFDMEMFWKKLSEVFDTE